MDMETSTKGTAAEPGMWDSHHLFQAAIAASEHDSDGEDPYGPQPKRFMQTEYQKRRHARDLEIRRMAWTMRKMRKVHKAIRQRMKEKQHISPFEKLPSDLVLKLMEHTHLRSITDLVRSSAINRSIFKANQNAIFRGVEVEQFPRWKWLFGDSRYRSAAQSQRLKDAIISENHSHNPGAHGWAYDEQLLEILRMIDDNKFTSERNVMFLQDMEDRVDVDIKATKLYTGKKIARQTAMCLRSFSFQRPGIVKEEDRTEDTPLVYALTLPWEARYQVMKEQPASTQAEIRSILTIIVETFCHGLQHPLRQWTLRHYSTPGNHKQPQEVKKWMSKLVTGLVLGAVIPRWRAATVEPCPVPFFLWDSASWYLAHDLGVLLKAHDEGNGDMIPKVRDGLDFGKSIGMDVEGLLGRTLVGKYIDIFDANGDGKA